MYMDTEKFNLVIRCPDCKQCYPWFIDNRLKFTDTIYCDRCKQHFILRNWDGKTYTRCNKPRWKTLFRFKTRPISMRKWLRKMGVISNDKNI